MNTKISLPRILTEGFHFYAYKVQLNQELQPTDHAQSIEFLEWTIE